LPDVPYKVVFEISQKGFDWWFPAAGVVIMVIGASSLLIGKPQKSTHRGAVYALIALSTLWTLLVLYSTLHEYLVLHQAYRKGQYSVVEGQVENFHPMPAEGHQDECFSVKYKTFCYSDFVLTAGFNNTASHGGPIRAGLAVRVAYVGDHILRLEVSDQGTPEEKPDTISPIQ
jgi:hypothetical protein